MIKIKSIKWVSLLLVAALFVIAGCGNNNNAGNSAASGGNAAGESTDSAAIAKIKERGKLLVGVKYDTRLFGLKDPASGNVEGFDIDISKAIARHILGDENAIELKEVTSKTRIPMLNNGEIDMVVATMTITEERKKEVDFSDVYFQAGQSLLVKKGSPITGLESVTKDTKILGSKGATSIKNIKEKVPGVTVLEFDNYQDAFAALKAGQGDALTTDDAILYGMAAQDDGYEVVGEPFTDEPYGIAVQKGNTDVVQAINDTLAELKANGEYDAIYTKWIGKAPAK
ncbi:MULTISPECIES: glutamate ABC transporter substrate-binding protein [unclassified Paenibacillus]|uniref:glutamate ABC transporter substrate-binding protein n=1 Tax=unclassified Paenibacillus TaxID=185978 RepID=UPI0024063371|nr:MULTISPECIES: glutamate ABC transporter substrate-binding protein [unclassified Paenibacillus]MDF9844603.1 putative glutamine transport system substrate-binding protein [Paenibacillus sp. PastF-2]MDF9851219.1 putative glutamine transport system substrate-binding protein [Paenibacillus sp. PastM-2]MDF9857788.1 putative glutamine transport system substrate-binding protein [Paenibacillus sp. PastF-1]MDH6483068.1 putative glutamine transport system substrate-binding protein [Paenibacillus sp. Pa